LGSRWFFHSLELLRQARRRLMVCGRRLLETRTEACMFLLILLFLVFSRRRYWYGYHPYGYGYGYNPYPYAYGAYTPYDPYWQARYYGYGHPYYRGCYW
jgi:hypothetical protein